MREILINESAWEDMTCLFAPSLDRLLEEHIHLEICPGCNIVCNIYPSIEEHPVNALFREGISLSINTDARTVANTSLDKEYQLLHHVFGWDTEEFLVCNINAIDACFASLPLKKQLKANLTG
ncbi:hypothetical protein [Enterobacter sp. RHBSTW-00340]|uniref:hypothetical protein n=1 Tax=unclassified Enterobacter TaxID=2608935 RepID=UPI0031F851F5